MYKIIGIYIFLFFINISISFSLDRAWWTEERSGEMKIKVINQTNLEIELYFNSLNNPIFINGNENYESEIMLMDFNYNYPLFIGIMNPNYNRINYYTFKRPQEISWNFCYYIIISPDDVPINRFRSINIFSEEEYLNFLNGSFSIIRSISGSADGWRHFNTIDSSNPDHNLEILIINDTSTIQSIRYYDHEKELNFELNENEARLIRIHNPIFYQGNRFNNIQNNYYNIQIENLVYHGIVEGIFRRIIQMEENMQIIRLRDSASGITIWNR